MKGKRRSVPAGLEKVTREGENTKSSPARREKILLNKKEKEVKTTCRGSWSKADHKMNIPHW